MTRQLIEIDVTFEGSYDKLTTKEIIKLLAEKSVKNLVIKNVNKRTGDK